MSVAFIERNDAFYFDAALKDTRKDMFRDREMNSGCISCNGVDIDNDTTGYGSVVVVASQE